ncbi:UNVERIFIED_CONTAM: hypothetical protein Slati_0385600 [Sesamum latifolium]|uniref:Uncharacterized protein n=1 Tax=Sesamum latifolium TaxID=2727402 RepID=A0AAW2XUH8_9LAMI
MGGRPESGCGWWAARGDGWPKRQGLERRVAGARGLGKGLASGRWAAQGAGGSAQRGWGKGWAAGARGFGGAQGGAVKGCRGGGGQRWE